MEKKNQLKGFKSMESTRRSLMNHRRQLSSISLNNDNLSMDTVEFRKQENNQTIEDFLGGNVKDANNLMVNGLSDFNIKEEEADFEAEEIKKAKHSVATERVIMDD